MRWFKRADGAAVRAGGVLLELAFVAAIGLVAVVVGRWLMLGERLADWVLRQEGSQRDELIWVPIATNLGFLVVAIRKWRLAARRLVDAEAKASTLERHATRDHLTGLSNRAALHELAEAAAARSNRSGRDLGAIFIDLVGFKAVNDRYDHFVGDAVLAETARRLKAVTRAGDVVARFGGDEFVVICDDPDGQATETLAQRIERALRAPHRVEGELIVVPPTIGVAVARPPLSGSELLRQADIAMYEAKLAGNLHHRLVRLAG